MFSVFFLVLIFWIPFYFFLNFENIMLGWALYATVLYLIQALFSLELFPTGVFEGFNEACWFHVCKGVLFHQTYSKEVDFIV